MIKKCFADIKKPATSKYPFVKCEVPKAPEENRFLTYLFASVVGPMLKRLPWPKIH